MIHILLTILKIIGIILLVIIGLILAILLCVLFVPVRYKAKIDYQEGKPDISVNVSYFLHAISVNAVYRDKKISKVLKIFGFKTKFLGDSDEADDNSRDGEDIFEEIKEEKKKRFLKKDLSGIKRNKQSDEIEEDYIMPVYEDKKEIKEDKSEITPKEEMQDINISENEEEEYLWPFSKYFAKIKKIIEKIKFKISGICGKIKVVLSKLISLKDKLSSLIAKLKNIKEFIDDENNRELFSFLWEQLKGVLSYVSPRKIRGYIKFGFEDPSTTGKTLGVIYMILKGDKKGFVISPDFDNKILDTKMQISGRIRIYRLLIVALKIYKNKNFKVFLERRRKNGK